MMRKPKHGFYVGARVVLIDEIDLFQDHIGETGTVTQATKDDIIVKFENGYRIITYPENLRLIEKDDE